MPVLHPGRPHVQSTPDCLVENALPPGRWRVSLVVVDAAGNESLPAHATITVTGPPPPRGPLARLRSWLAALAGRLGWR